MGTYVQMIEAQAFTEQVLGLLMMLTQLSVQMKLQTCHQAVFSMDEPLLLPSRWPFLNEDCQRIAEDLDEHW